MAAADNCNRSNCKPAIGAVVLIALTVVGLANAKLVESKVKSLMSWSRTLGPWAGLLMFALSTLMPVIMLPVFPLMALSGPLFTGMYGDWQMGGTVAFATVFTGLWLGSVIAFSLGKTIFRSLAQRASETSTTVQRINRLVESGGIKIVLMARASPMMPAEIFDYACSITTLTVGQYAVGCLGSAVPVAFWTYSSAQAAFAAHQGSPSNEKTIGLIVINVVALAALTALLVSMISREEAAAMAPDNPMLATIQRASTAAGEAAALANRSPLVQTLQRASWTLPATFRLQAPAHGEAPLQEQLLLPQVARTMSSPP